MVYLRIFLYLFSAVLLLTHDLSIFYSSILCVFWTYTPTFIYRVVKVHLVSCVLLSSIYSNSLHRCNCDFFQSFRSIETKISRWSPWITSLLYGGESIVRDTTVISNVYPYFLCTVSKRSNRYLDEIAKTENFFFVRLNYGIYWLPIISDLYT